MRSLSPKILKILSSSTAQNRQMLQLDRLERLIKAKGGDFPAELRGSLAYQETLRDINKLLILKLKRKGFNVDHDTLTRWLRVRGGIYYRKDCAYHGELRALCEEPGGFGLLRPKGEHIDNLARYAVEEAGFYVQDCDVNHFLELIRQDLNYKDVFSMWKEVEIGGEREVDGRPDRGASPDQDGTEEDPF